MERIVTANLTAPQTFDVRTRSDHSLTVRAGAVSAADPGPAPMELMLASLAGCAAATIESVAGKMRIRLDDLVVGVEATRSEKPPRVWTDVRVRYHLRGEVPLDRAERAANVADRACPASVMIGRAARVDHSVFLVRTVAEPDTVAVRHAVLRAGMPLAAVEIPGDGEATWFGVLHRGEVLGTAGLFEEQSPDGDSPLRLRGMATSAVIRGSGLGGMLMDAVLDRARSLGAGSVWCSARTPAAGFYLRRGWEAVSDEYDVERLGPHLRMRIGL